MTQIELEVTSDYICPWCYIGVTRIERIARELSAQVSIDITYLPYQLYPEIPKGGTHKSKFSNKTKPGMGKALKAESAIENIQINYKNIENIPNSFEAHRLHSLIGDKAKKRLYVHELFTAYFRDGQNIEDVKVLTDIAISIKSAPKTIDTFSQTKTGTEETQNLIRKAKEEYINVVPSVRIDNRILLPGLQAEKLWKTYFLKAAKLKQNNT